MENNTTTPDACRKERLGVLGIDPVVGTVPSEKSAIWTHMHARAEQLRDRLDRVQAMGSDPIFVYRWRDAVDGFERLLATILGRQADMGPYRWAAEMHKVVVEGHLSEEQVMLRLAQTLVGIESAFKGRVPL